MSELIEEVESGDKRRALTAMRDYIAHELAGNRCHTCEMSRLKTGDQAAMLLRLQQIIEELDKSKPIARAEGVTSLDDIRNRRRAALGQSNTPVHDDAKLGTNKAPRRQGGRRPSSGSN
jgi:hypothetical protein